jgi:hypothetical protein
MGREFMAKVGKVGELDEEKERVAVSFCLLWFLGITLIKLGFQWWRPTAMRGFQYIVGSFL